MASGVTLWDQEGPYGSNGGPASVQQGSILDPRWTPLGPKGCPLGADPIEESKIKESKTDLKWVKDGDLELKLCPNEPTRFLDYWATLSGPILCQTEQKHIFD